MKLPKSELVLELMYWWFWAFTDWIYNSIVDMARNKGLIPSAPAEISIQRKQIKTIIESLLPACTEPDPITGEPFQAQAIIANPPAYG